MRRLLFFLAVSALSCTSWAGLVVLATNSTIAAPLPLRFKEDTTLKKAYAALENETEGAKARLRTFIKILLKARNDSKSNA